MRTRSHVQELIAFIGLLCFTAAEATPKKITVQGVIRRAGATGTDALINTSPSSSNATVSLLCQNNGANTCPGGTSQTYTVSGGGLVEADNTIFVRNGAFSVSLRPTDATVQAMLSSQNANWFVVIDGQLDDFSPSTTFQIALEGVPFAAAAGVAQTAMNSIAVGGATVDVTGWSTGKVLKFDAAGQLVVGDDNNSGGGGGGGTTYSAGTGIVINGASSNVINVDVGTSVNQIPQLGAGGKLSTSLLDTGTGNGQLPILDGTGKLDTNVLPNIPYANLPLTGVSSLVQLDAGKIPSSYIDATSIPNDTINANHISAGAVGTSEIGDDQVTNAKIADNAVDTLQIADGAVTNAKVASGIDAAKLSGYASLTGVSTNTLWLNNQGEVRFVEGSGGGVNYLALRAPATLAADLTWTLPDVDGTNGQILKFNSATKTFYWDNDAGASGGVSGPGSSTSNGIARWNGTAGTTLKNSSIVIDDSDNLSGAASIATSGTLSAATVNVSGLTGSRVVLTDGSSQLVSAAVSSTELGYLSGVTSSLASRLNSVTDTEVGYLSGSTANIQTQLNAKLGSADISGKLDKAGDTMTGDLGLAGSQATASRALILDSQRRVASSSVTDTELAYLSGVTSALGAKVNAFTAAEAGYLSGVTSSLASKLNPVTDTEVGYLSGSTANIQTQINSIVTGGNFLAKAGDTMTGDLGLAGSQATASRALIIDSQRRVASSSVTDTELAYLSGATASIQTQINNIVTGGGFLAKAGDTMTGDLGLAGSQATASRALIIDSQRRVASSSVTDTELAYLSGVTSALGAKVNAFTAAEAGYLSGSTANIQTQLNAKLSSADISGKLDKAGDTMTGDLGLAGSQATASRALIIDSQRRVASSSVTDTELAYLSGVTSALGAKVNAFTAAEAGYLSGVTSSLASKLNPVTDTEVGYLSGSTANIQTQLNAKLSSADISGKLDKAGDTMTGDLGLAGSQATASRALIIDSQRRVASSSVTDTELAYLSGVTSALGAKVNAFTAAEAGYLSGATANIQTQLNAKEGSISTAATSNYWRGDKTWVDFDTSVRAAVITGVNTSLTGAISATDTVLQALGRLQYQISNGGAVLSNDSVTSAHLKNDVAGSEAVSFDVLRTTTSNGESHAENAQRVIADRVYGTGSTEGTDKLTIPSIVRIPLSVAHTDCGMVDVDSAPTTTNDLVVCAGF